MDIQIDRSKEYSFEEALAELKTKDVIITSKNTGDSYIAEKFKTETILKFYSKTIDNWQKCTYIEPKEIFNKWYVTNKESKGE